MQDWSDFIGCIEAETDLSKNYKNYLDRELNQLITFIGTGQFDIHLSIPLVLEYTDVLLRELPKLYLSREEVGDLIDFYCAVGGQENSTKNMNCLQQR